MTADFKRIMTDNYNGWRRKNPALSGKHWSLFRASQPLSQSDAFVQFLEGVEIQLHCVFCLKDMSYTRQKKGDPVDKSLREHWLSHEDASPGLREFATETLRTPYRTRTRVVEGFGESFFYRPPSLSSNSDRLPSPPVPDSPPPPPTPALPQVVNPLPLRAFPTDFPLEAMGNLNPGLWSAGAQPNFKTANWRGVEVFVASGCKDSVDLGKPQLVLSFFYERIRLTRLVLVDGTGVVCAGDEFIQEKFRLLEKYKYIAVRLSRLPDLWTEHARLVTVLATLNSTKKHKIDTQKPLHYLVELISDVLEVAPLFLDNLCIQWNRISGSEQFSSLLSPHLLKHRDLAPLDTLVRRLSEHWSDPTIVFLRNTIYYRSGQSKVSLNSIAKALGFSHKGHLRSVLGDGCWFSLAKFWLSDFRDTNCPFFRLGVAALLCYNRRKALSRKDALEVLKPLARGEVKIYIPCLPSILAVFVTLTNPESGSKLETVEDVELSIRGGSDMKRRMADEWSTVKDENLDRRVAKWIGMIFDEKTSRFSHEKRRDASPRRR